MFEKTSRLLTKCGIIWIIRKCNTINNLKCIIIYKRLLGIMFIVLNNNKQALLFTLG